MSRIRRILVAVKEPWSRGSAAVAKGAEMARVTGASLELFHGIATPILAESYLYSKRSLADIEREIGRGHFAELERTAARLRRRGIKVLVSVDWDYPPHEAIVRRALLNKVDLIVAEQHAGWRAAPWLLRLTDWELLRSSPVPVLLVGSRSRSRRRPVLAALDPSHAYAKSSKLDPEILRAARMIADVLGGKVHAMHAFFPVPGNPMNADFLGRDLLAQVRHETRVNARRAFKRALRNSGIPEARRHLVERYAVDAIPRVAREIGAAVVVMGIVSRSGIKRVFIGNTAERVLGRLPCDVLVVKPPRFKTPVARASRGVRIVSSPPPPPY